MFWIVATYAKCLIVLDRGAATDAAARHRGGFHDLLDDLGVRHPRRYGTVGVPRAPTFRACGVALDVMDASPRIVDRG